jgi:hypothetical protein
VKEFRRGHALFAVCFQLTMETTPPELPMQDKKTEYALVMERICRRVPGAIKITTYM